MRARYPADWKLRRRLVRFQRAQGRCEFILDNGDRCPARHGEPSPWTGAKVVLTTAHVWDHRPEAASLLNLAAWCQKHHLAWDRVHLADERAARREAKRNQLTPRTENTK